MRGVELKNEIFTVGCYSLEETISQVQKIELLIESISPSELHNIPYDPWYCYKGWTPLHSACQIMNSQFNPAADLYSVKIAILLLAKEPGLIYTKTANKKQLMPIDVAVGHNNKH